MKSFNDKVIECGISLLGIMFAQLMILNGTDFGYKHFVMGATVVMELAIMAYFIAAVIELSWNSIKFLFHKLA